MNDLAPGSPPAPQGVSSPQPPLNPYLRERAAGPQPVAPFASVAVHAGAPSASPASPLGYPVAPGGASSAPYATNAQAYASTAPRTNTLALVSMILSLAAFIVGITAIAGIVCGHVALAQIGRTGESGKGMAIAGVVVGYTITLFGVLFFLVPILSAIYFISVGG